MRAEKEIADAGGLLKVLADGHPVHGVEVDARREARDRIVTLHAALQAMVRELGPENAYKPVVKQAKAALLGPL